MLVESTGGCGIDIWRRGRGWIGSVGGGGRGRVWRDLISLIACLFHSVVGGLCRFELALLLEYVLAQHDLLGYRADELLVELEHVRLLLSVAVGGRNDCHVIHSSLCGLHERVRGPFDGVARVLQALHGLRRVVSFDLAGDKECRRRAGYLLGRRDEALFGAVALDHAVGRLAQRVTSGRHHSRRRYETLRPLAVVFVSLLLLLLLVGAFGVAGAQLAMLPFDLALGDELLLCACGCLDEHARGVGDRLGRLEYLLVEVELAAVLVVHSCYCGCCRLVVII